MTTDFTTALQEEFASVSGQLTEIRTEEEEIRTRMGEQLRAVAEKRIALEARLRHLQALLALEGKLQHSEAMAMFSSPGVVGARPLADEAYEFLSESAHEWHYQDLATALANRGVNIPGRDPAKNLVAHIHRDPRFVRPKRGTYGLIEWYPKGTKSVGVRKPTRSKVRANTRRSRARRPQ
jgi:hypothetical protein